MKGLQMHSPVRLCCLLITVVYLVSAQKPVPTLINEKPMPRGPGQGSYMQAFRQFLNLLLTDYKQKLETGLQSLLPPLVANSPCLSTTEKRKEFFEDLREYFGLSSGEDEDDEDESTTKTPGQDMDSDDDLEKFTDSTLSCIKDMLNIDIVTNMCKQISRNPASIKNFKKLIAAGFNCIRYLRDTDMDGDDDLDLDDAQQDAILDKLLEKDVKDWNDDDLGEALVGAPDLIDDDILEDLPDSVFNNNLDKLVKLAKKGKGSPNLGVALQDRIRKRKAPSQLTAADINQLGGGIRFLDVDDLDEIDDDELDDADLDFDDLDDDEPLGLAIGRKLKKKNNQPNMVNATTIRRIFKYIKSDRGYLAGLDAEALEDALDDIKDDDLDDDEASSVCQKIRESDAFDDPSTITGEQIRRLGNVLKGCGEDFFMDLPPQALKGALSRIKDIDFEPSEAREIFRKLNMGLPNTFTAATIRNLEKLMNGLNTAELDDIPDSALVQALDILDDIDFDDAAENILVEKIRKGSNGRIPTALFKSEKFQDIMSLDDLDDLDLNEVMTQLTTLGNVKWNPVLANQLVRKMMAQNTDGVKYGATEIATLGSLVVGLSEDDIENIKDDRDDVMATASILGEHDDDLTDGQSESMADMIEKVLGDGSVEMDDLDALRAGRFIPYMDDDDSDKIRFTPTGGKAFVNLLSKVSSSKLSLRKMMYLAKKSIQLLKAAKKQGEDDMLTKEDVRSMIGSLLGLSGDDIRGLSKDAFMGNLDAFSKLPLSKEQGKALVEKVEDFDKEYYCKSDRLAQLGSNLQYLPEDKLKTICKAQLSAAASTIIKKMDSVDDEREERVKNGFGREETDDTSDRQEKVVEVIRESLTVTVANGRRRRAAMGLKCDEVKIMGKQATKIAVDEFFAMTKVEFSNCLETLGQLSDWSPEHLNVLVKKAISELYQHTSWSVDSIKRIGSIVAGLSSAEISQLSLTTVDAMHSIGKHGLMSISQLKAGFAKWLGDTKGGNAAMISGAELSSLSEFVCGAEIPHIQKLNVDAFKQAERTIGNAKSCSHDQLKEYGKRAVAAYGSDVKTWSPPVVSDLGRIVGGLESTHVSMMTPSQINMIRPEIIPRLPSQTLGALKVDQFNQFSSNQANSVTQAQYDSLTPAQQSSLQAKASVSFKGDDPAGGVDSVSPVGCLALLMVAFITSSLL
ncbi:hypothetical protein SNE40_019639 [Patella caerulea]|uniref:Uncharacterized protein n=1 Tax=Patella caerulea TaxID=87958 RepID=A0AAN8J6T8_PATCE